ncbi:MAG: hypothetical protein JOY67_15585 [Hyphomicrobiales bacterium]|nr:hypothetical protein [Hyphomicrobiales bacterium]MBV9114235.1 hypothetical protein [Hyphomicrobiales bacterium]MBV9519405.1 hypothetical protein [Hyphomicrobiales bacterium]
MSDTTIIDDAIIAETSVRRYLHFSAIIGGALAGAAVGTVLNGFGVAIGLAVSSTSPTWRDTSMALVLLTGLFLLFVSIVSSGIAGYVAARAAPPEAMEPTEEGEFRDGLNGLVAWALAVLLTALLVYAAAQLGSHATSPSTTTAPNASAGENLLAFDLDRLFRSDAAPEPNIAYDRAQAARILLTANSHSGMSAQDHDYLVHLVSRRAGLSAADAGHRVDDVVASAKDNVARARRSGVILAFMAAAAALIGAAIAWSAAVAAGRHREGLGASHLWRWDRRAGASPFG